MAKLEQCKECGKEISKNAKVCVHCGEPSPVKRESSLSYYLVAIIVLIFLFIIFGYDDDTNHQSYKQPSSSEVVKNSSAITIQECEQLREIINNPSFTGTEAQGNAMQKYSNNDCSSLEGEPTKERRLQEIRDTFR